MTEKLSVNKYNLTFPYDLSKCLVLTPIPQQDAEIVNKEFVLKFVAPAQILTDQGSDILSDLFKSACKLLKIRKIQITALILNRLLVWKGHRVLAHYLRHYVHD